MTALEGLRTGRHPRSSTYDAAWLVGLDMGPNPLWLLEDLAQDLGLRPGMRVLDLGSGRGATSVFLAHEFGVQVVAADLWVSPDDAAAVFAAAGVGDRVLAVRAEAHALPFGARSFDAVVSIDAFEYFGTSEHYLPSLARFVVPGGGIGVATPALRTEVGDVEALPPHVRACVGWEALAWHTPRWWEQRWAATGAVDAVRARWQDDGWHDWLVWQRAVAEASGTQEDGVLAMLEADQGRHIGFTLVTARAVAGPSSTP
ncbi:SAM-dependent methyltransferase [Cellulomonas sp. S1-8]|uniref:SAM-dependent methyltransferase n=1 Tax=Cellulomonas sp. S1-8 TaxID=2904790 RepID=UPI002243FDB0|nr:methyltransferase domain-containing protein [Cellulomonas sp. S1-8]UZN03642.1 methyltransferase domain-containing protein [Cellulomonas sp. S1-8]